MKISNSKRLALAAALSAAALGATMAACSSDDSSNNSTPDSGSGSGSGSSGGSGSGSSGGDSGQTGDAGTLYTRLGGHAGIASAISAIVTKELTYPDIASFFAPNLDNPNHQPQPADIEECFTDLLGNKAGGPEVYPTTTASGFTCRDMNAAHSDLHIGNGTFDEFVSIAATELATLGVASGDITTIGNVLNSTKTDIVDPNAPDGGTCVAPACDAGVIPDAATGG